MGVFGLCFFMVGYVRARNDLAVVHISIAVRPNSVSIQFPIAIHPSPLLRFLFLSLRTSPIPIPRPASDKSNFGGVVEK